MPVKCAKCGRWGHKVEGCSVGRTVKPGQSVTWRKKASSSSGSPLQVGIPPKAAVGTSATVGAHGKGVDAKSDRGDGWQEVKRGLKGKQVAGNLSPGKVVQARTKHVSNEEQGVVVLVRTDVNPFVMGDYDSRSLER
ncbi:hypothetical protein Dimus_022350 [Dionaea muscipula]